MKIIIPLAGEGIRFKNYGYKSPKPLIKALGKEIIEWLLDNLKIRNEDKIYIIYEKSLDSYNFQKRLKKYQINFLKLENKTSGPVETLSKIFNNFSENDDENTLILDGDTFYLIDILKKIRLKKNPSIFFHKTKVKEPIFSYIKTRGKYVQAIKEKKKISNKANTGAYYFSSLKKLREVSKIILNKNKKAYVSEIYNYFLKKKILIESIQVNSKDFHCLGTPNQLQNFCKNFKIKNKQRFCFDLDNTLVTFPKVRNDYSTVEPIYENIEILNFLKEQGHYIIIYTARRMRTHNGNIKKVKKDIKKITTKTLNNYNIQYDELIFGKPYANFYIDDLGISADENLNFSLGFYNNAVSRKFNSIDVYNDFTIKKSNNKKLFQEIKYYKNIPIKLKKFFPKLVSYDHKSYKIETINGSTFSYLYVNEFLKSEFLTKLLKTLNKIHSFNFSKKLTDKKIYQNYTKKIFERKKDIGNHLNIDLAKNSFFKNLIKELEIYEKKNFGIQGIIHGDPVFTNVFIEHGNTIKLIDPRGGQIKNFSIFGDIFYDYGKVLQSIFGYDHLITEKKLNEKTKVELIECFEKIILNKWNKSRLAHIYLICSSHYLSLIPFHKKDLARHFFNLSKKTFYFYKKLI